MRVLTDRPIWGSSGERLACRQRGSSERQSDNRVLRSRFPELVHTDGRGSMCNPPANSRLHRAKRAASVTAICFFQLTSIACAALTAPEKNHRSKSSRWMVGRARKSLTSPLSADDESGLEALKREIPEGKVQTIEKPFCSLRKRRAASRRRYYR